MSDRAHSKPARGRPKSTVDVGDQNIIKSLDRAMSVLSQLSTMSGATLSELARETGQSAPTLYRILTTLHARGLVEQDADSQIWRIGAQALVLGARYLARNTLVERAAPILRRLQEQTGETASLGTAHDAQVLFLAQAESLTSIRAYHGPGTSAPMHASGIGKALLAQMSDDGLSRLIATAPLDRFTNRTLTAPSALRADLEATRDRGHAIDDEEWTEGMRSVAALVGDISGTGIAGIAISGPVHRMGSDTLPHLAGVVMQAAADLSAAIGGGVQ